MMMRRHSWTAFGTCIFLISDVANFLSQQGRLGELKIKHPEIYESLKNLYGFALLAIGKRPDAEEAFAFPENGNPFT